MPTWDSLSNNELVDLDAIANAVSLGYFAFQSGQSTLGGTQCVTVSEAKTLLQLNTSYMPTDGRMPVKSNFVGASSSVRVILSEQISPVFVDGNIRVYEPGIGSIVDQVTSPYDEVFTIDGGTLVHATVYASEASSGSDPLKTLQVLENGVTIYAYSDAQLGPDIDWEKRILPNSTYVIAGFTSSGNVEPTGIITLRSKGIYTITEVVGTYEDLPEEMQSAIIAPGESRSFQFTGSIGGPETLIVSVTTPTPATGAMALTYSSDGYTEPLTHILGSGDYEIVLSREVTAPDGFIIEISYV